MLERICWLPQILAGCLATISHRPIGRPPERRKRPALDDRDERRPGSANRRLRFARGGRNQTPVVPRVVRAVWRVPVCCPSAQRSKDQLGVHAIGGRRRCVGLVTDRRGAAAGGRGIRLRDLWRPT
jgi:hypothetical protein